MRMRSLFWVSRSHQALKSNWGVKENYRISSANASIRVNDFGVVFRLVTQFTGAKQNI